MGGESSKKNILILTMARSRSSLLAEIIRQHGFNCPEPYGFKTGYPAGTNENPALKRLLNSKRGGDYRGVFKHDFYPHMLYADIEHVMPPQPWMCKVDTFCWPAFEDVEHVKILCMRRFEDVVASNVEKNHRYEKQQFEEIVTVHVTEAAKLDGFVVNTDHLVAGDYHEIKTAIEAAGAEFDAELTDSLCSVPA